LRRGLALSKLRLIPYNKLKKIIESKGFEWKKCEGSHNSFKNSEGRMIVIPDHGSDVIVRPLLRKILNDTNISIEEYNKLLNNL
jgi:predicted RNA binding protein YcfA (HicA-like mRNA interferase family)